MISVGSIMDTQMIAARDNATLKEVYSLMRRFGVSDFPIVDGDYNFKGIVYEHQLLKTLYPDNATSVKIEELKLAATYSDRVHIADLMSTNVRVTYPEADILRVGEQMVTEGTKSMPVVENKKLVGMLHQSRIFLALMNAFLTKDGLALLEGKQAKKKKPETHFINEFKDSERRMHARKRVKLLVAYKEGGLEGETRGKKGRVAAGLDISAGGLLLHTDEKLEPGMLVDVAFDISGQRKPIKRLARVMHCNLHQPSGAYRAGIMFLAMSSAERHEIAEYLDQRRPEEKEAP